MKKTRVTIAILLLMTFVYSYNQVQARYAGIAEDIKYTGKYKDKFLFVVFTDSNRIYQILCEDIPYFSVGDTLIEYWFDYKLSGLGKQNEIYYYTIVK